MQRHLHNYQHESLLVLCVGYHWLKICVGGQGHYPLVVFPISILLGLQLPTQWPYRSHLKSIIYGLFKLVLLILKTMCQLKKHQSPSRDQHKTEVFELCHSLKWVTDRSDISQLYFPIQRKIQRTLFYIDKMLIYLFLSLK